MVGCGKLGLMVALTIESCGHIVRGCDVSSEPGDYLKARAIPFQEEGAQALLDKTNMEIVPLEIGIPWADIIMVAPQTPHGRAYEGDRRLPSDRQDFYYGYLIDAIEEINHLLKEPKIVNVISTCLPGTYEETLKRFVGPNMHYVYSPLYIAMGTVYKDYLNPEFVLVGRDPRYPDAVQALRDFYSTIHDAPIFETDITTAEGIKVFYNTFITAKTLLANAWMQMAHKTGMNVDDITAALSLATDRLLSSKYLRGGGPDSGGCHPRDLIALSWLGEQIGLKPNLFEIMAQVREQQTEWIADLIYYRWLETRLPVYVLGRTFKPETNLTVGSGAILLSNILREKKIQVIEWDPYAPEFKWSLRDNEKHLYDPEFKRGIYIVATAHEVFKEFEFPKGSIVYDLWRYLPKQEGVTIIPIGSPGTI